MRTLASLAVVIVILILLLAPVINAATPQLINYQAVLTDPNNNNAPYNGTVNISFKIYDAATGGNILWQEVLPTVVITDGQLDTLLGSVVPVTSTVFNGPVRYLGVTIGTDSELQPRTQLATVPWAFGVSTIEGASGGTVSGTISCDNVITGIVSTGDIVTGHVQTNSITMPTGATDGYVLTSDPAGVGTWQAASGGGSGWNWSDSAGEPPHWVDSATYADSSLYADSTDAITNGAIDLSDLGANGANNGDVIKYFGGGVWAPVPDETGGGGWTDDGTVVRLDLANDSVGIGTTSPSAKLDVVGDLKVSDKATIGPGHTNSGANAFVAGDANTASGSYSTIGGGNLHLAEGFASVVGGGRQNYTNGNYSTVSGGRYNAATDAGATVGGGITDSATAMFSTIAGGTRNSVSGIGSTISGGADNLVQAMYSVITGGSADTIASAAHYSYLFGIGSKLTQDSTFMVDMPHIRFGDEASGYEFPTSDGLASQVLQTDGSGNVSWATGGGGGGNWTLTGNMLKTNGDWGIARASNTLVGGYDSTHINFGVACTTGLSPGPGIKYATVSGGYGNIASGEAATVSGGRYNEAGDGAVAASVGGGHGNTASASYARVGGGYQNKARGVFSVVAGGGYFGSADSNSANGMYSFIGGGKANVIGTSGHSSVISGGDGNTANGSGSVVGGGYHNFASGGSTVCGGSSDTATGYNSIVLGGSSNYANGDFSLAAGFRSKAWHDGSFVWADSSDLPEFTSTAQNQFLVRASGGVGFGTDSPQNQLDVEGAVALGAGYSGTSVAPANGLIVEGKVGLGTTVAQNQLDVEGGVAVGAGYSGTSVAPANGLIVEGKVGLGTTVAQNQLDVEGGVAVGAGYSGTSVAPVNGLIVEGNVGLGTTVAQNQLDVEGSVAIGANYSGTNTAPTNGMLIEGNVGIGTASPGFHKLSLESDWSGVNGTTLNVKQNNSSGLAINALNNSNDVTMLLTNQGSGDVLRCDVYPGGVWTPVFKVTNTGRVVTTALEITGGGDLAEPFPMTDEDEISEGALVVIDEDNPGQLKLSETAYDSHVAGIVSGAGGVNPGITLSQSDELGSGPHVALSGRVYCLADASYGAIKAGDMLTTSDTPGHAMVVNDRDRAYGAVIGKAMGTLEEGQGLILVLVSLQ